MSIAPTPAPARTPTLGEILDGLHPSLPPNRVVCWPAPGTASIDDVLAIREREGRLCELVDGTLVEKAMGARESLYASILIQILWNHVEGRGLGIVLGADGSIRLDPRIVRIPDVAFYSTDRLKTRRALADAAPVLVPDLAVEVLSPSNTSAEMDRKVREYLEAGASAVWLVHPDRRQVEVHAPGETPRRLGDTARLEAAGVLPGLSIDLARWFDRAALLDLDLVD